LSVFIGIERVVEVTAVPHTYQAKDCGFKNESGIIYTDKKEYGYLFINIGISSYPGDN